MNRIKEVLEKKGIKQAWLAEKLGKSFSIINSSVYNRSNQTSKLSSNCTDIESSCEKVSK